MAKSKKASAKAIVDVAKPGESAPPATSKSVIINNRPILKDPMVVDEASSSDDGGQSASTSKLATTDSEKSRLQPTADPLLGTKAADEASAAPQASGSGVSPSKSITPPDEVAKTATKASSTKDSAANAKPDDSSDKAKTNDQSSTAKPDEAESTAEETAAAPAKAQDQIEAASVEQAKHDAAIEKLVDGKQYYLPINTVEERRSRRFVALGILFSLLLVLAWADIALDAGLIQINGVKPVTHFFSN